MKILLSAFAFAPSGGSEGGVGMRWATELAKNHDVVVITDVTRRELIESSDIRLKNPRIQFVYFRPNWLKNAPLNFSTAQLLYISWQFSLLPFARRLHKQHQFDIAMHISYGVHRHPSFLGWLGIPFVFGPLGGGEDAPLRLKRSIKGNEKFRELVRTAINKLVLFDPFLWAAYARSSLILVKTAGTKAALPWPFRGRAVVYQEIGIDVPDLRTRPTRAKNEALKVLFAGRLLGLKGVHFAIRAMAHLWALNLNIELTIVGRGPYEDELRLLAKVLGIEERIVWISHLPQPELFALYGQMHCLLFPSLHDSSGNVVLEAQAYGLPVICLDLGGPPTLVAADSSIVVCTWRASEEQVVDRLADSIVALWKDESRRRLMGDAAIRHAKSMNWADRVSGVMTMSSQILASRKAG